MEQRLTIPTDSLHFKEPHLAGGCSAEVLESVRQLGVVNPLLVAKRGERFRVYIGNQRLSAARQLGIQKLPCVVVRNSTEVREALHRYEDIPCQS